MPTMMIMIHALAVAVLIMTLLAGPVAAPGATGPDDLPRGHRQITGVVTQKGGGLVVTTPAGAPINSMRTWPAVMAGRRFKRKTR